MHSDLILEKFLNLIEEVRIATKTSVKAFQIFLIPQNEKSAMKMGYRE